MKKVRKLQRSAEKVLGRPDIFAGPGRTGVGQRCLELVGKALLGWLQHLATCFYCLPNLCLA